MPRLGVFRVKKHLEGDDFARIEKSATRMPDQETLTLDPRNPNSQNQESRTHGEGVRIDGPRGGVNWAFFKFLEQIKQP